MARLGHHEFETSNGCDLEDVHKRIDVVFLDQIQVLDLDVFLLYELPDDLDQLLIAMLPLLEPFLHCDVLCALFNKLDLVRFCLSHGLQQ